MRENDSDGGDGWQLPGGYVSPWAPHEASGTAGTPEIPEASGASEFFEALGPSEAPGPFEAPESPGSSGAPESFWSGASAIPAPGDDDRDIVAFGMPADEGSDGQGFYVQPGHWGQPGYGRAEYGSGYGRGSGGAGWTGAGAPPPPPPPPPLSARRGRGGGRFGVYVAVAALAACIGAGATVAIDRAGPSASASSRDIPPPHNNAAGSGSSTLNQIAVADKVKPGLVDIVSTLKYDGETAEGTGMILSPSGLVLTNNHVIDGATSVVARLVDSGKSYRARVVGYDDTDDVALLQLQHASGLATVDFGNSSQVSLGTAVLALGNAEGRGGATPAAGIINALNRSIQASDEGSGTVEYLYHMMQTNAAIQQGDSGGALADNAGKVIGMITAADTASPGPFGNTIGFAIPINSALAIARQIAAGQASSTVYIGVPGFLGVEVAQSDSPNPRQQAADEERAGNGGQGGNGQGGGNAACLLGGQPAAVPARIAPASTGALILGILCGTAADSRGLMPGDVITSVDGQAVTTPDSLTSITTRYRPGDVVSVGWVGVGGARHTTSIRLGEGPAR